MLFFSQGKKNGTFMIRMISDRQIEIAEGCIFTSYDFVKTFYKLRHEGLFELQGKMITYSGRILD